MTGAPLNAAPIKPAHNVPVLMYHHVTPAGGMIAATPANFESQIAWLARNGYTALTADRFVAHLAGQPAPEKSVLITFDDGYLDNWVHAHPVLQRYGMHAVLFVVTGWLGQGAVRPYAGQAGAPAAPDHDACKAAIAGGRTDDVMARWSEIQAMQAAGTFEIHSHTHTHTRWDRECGNDAAAKRGHMDQELASSRDALISHLGAVSPHLCWPQGYFDADYLESGRTAGFRYFYTTDALGQNTAGASPEHIYRFAVRNQPAAWLARRLWLSGHPVWGPRYHAWKAWKKRLKGRA
jgi:peptidoglycan/xylan/chitin deacetylase (PgdA/CDA1 family)